MWLRRRLVLLAAASAVVGACGSSRPSWTPSVEPIDGPTSVELWRRPLVGNESGYFCAIDCTGGGACPSGQAGVTKEG